MTKPKRTILRWLTAGTSRFSEEATSEPVQFYLHLHTVTRREWLSKHRREKILFTNLIGSGLSWKSIIFLSEAWERKILTIERINMDRWPTVNDNIGWITFLPCSSEFHQLWLMIERFLSLNIISRLKTSETMRVEKGTKELLLSEMKHHTRDSRSVGLFFFGINVKARMSVGQGKRR